MKLTFAKFTNYLIECNFVFESTSAFEFMQKIPNLIVANLISKTFFSFIIKIDYASWKNKTRNCAVNLRQSSVITKYNFGIKLHFRLEVFTLISEIKKK